MQSVEQYAENVINTHPEPSRRPVSILTLLKFIPTPTRIVIIFLGTIPLIIEGVYRSGDVFRNISSYRSIIWLMFIIAYPCVLFSEVFQPLYRWWYAIRFGYKTVAKITKIYRVRLHYGDAMQGSWTYTFNGKEYTNSFMIDNFWPKPWIWGLKPGSEVVLLIHPCSYDVVGCIREI